MPLMHVAAVGAEVGAPVGDSVGKGDGDAVGVVVGDAVMTVQLRSLVLLGATLSN